MNSAEYTSVLKEELFPEFKRAKRDLVLRPIPHLLSNSKVPGDFYS
jgi:hypothetical protein